MAVYVAIETDKLSTGDTDGSNMLGAVLETTVSSRNLLQPPNGEGSWSLGWDGLSHGAISSLTREQGRQVGGPRNWLAKDHPWT